MDMQQGHHPVETAQCVYCRAHLNPFFYFCLGCGTPYKRLESLLPASRPRRPFRDVSHAPRAGSQNRGDRRCVGAPSRQGADREAASYLLDLDKFQPCRPVWRLRFQISSCCCAGSGCHGVKSGVSFTDNGLVVRHPSSSPHHRAAARRLRNAPGTKLRVRDGGV